MIRHLKEEIFKIENRVIFSCDLLENVAERQLRHLHRVAKFRHSTLAEWIKIWPISQDQEINNFNGHRRLFRNCEPFLSSDIVKLAASVPPEWKIGRRLFQRATKPLLRRSWFVPHAGEGHFPYFSGKPNIALRFFCTKYREIYRKSHPSKHYNQGPWPDWDAVVKTKQMDNLIEEHEAYYGS